jgi:adenosylcobinamide-GDP ribazoletransferase
MKYFRIALRFLTRYPITLEEEFAVGDFGRATAYFPVVGLLAGLDLFLLRYAMLFDKNGLHYYIWCFILLLFWVWASDSLHLDGLADTADALASGRDGKDFRLIMHDSRSGAFGVMAVCLALIGKFAWLVSLPMQNFWFLPLPLLFSRLHSTLACQLRPYAGQEGSLSSMFIEESKASDLNGALMGTLFGFFLLALPSVYFGFCSPLDVLKAFAVSVAGLGVAWSFLRLPMRRLGGISGDLIGWAQVICELSIALGLTLVLVH